MTDRNKLKQAYKLNPPPAGVYQIKNLRNGKILIGSALNVHGKRNGIQFELRQGHHFNEALQADLDQFGPEAFVVEILDELKPAEGETRVDPEELRALEALWLEKVQPYNEKGYNVRKG